MITDTQEVIAMGQQWSQDVRVRELQSQLETHEQRLQTMREHLIKLQLANLQSQLRKKDDDIKGLQAPLKAKEQTNSKQERWLSTTEEEEEEELHEEDVADEGTSQDTEMQSDSTLRTKQENREFTDVQGQSPKRRLNRRKKERVFETPQKTLTTNEEEKIATGQQKSKFRVREEEATELQSNLETPKEEIKVPTGF